MQERVPHRRLLSFLCLCVVLTGESGALAVGTRQFLLEEGEDFEGGDLQGVSVDSAGHVRAGFNLGSLPLTTGNAVWSALETRDGRLYLGTGNAGQLLELRDGKLVVAAETKTLVVTSVVEGWRGALYLGTLPNGKIFELAQGKLRLFATLKESEHIWQLAFDAARQVLYAGTGPEGKLWRLTADGQAQLYFDAEEQQLMSLAVMKDGAVLAGASDKAKLYKVTAAGRASVVFDFGRTEVRQIAVAANGDIYAIANELTQAAKAPSEGTKVGQVAGPARTTNKTKGKGMLVRFAASGAMETLLDNTDEHFVSLALDDRGRPYVGTGLEGRVYTVDGDHHSVLVADVAERQIGAMLLFGKRRWIASSDPPVLRPIRSVGGPDAVWTSKVLDAGLSARFGRMNWEATGQLEFATRTGNTSEPDGTWSDWSRAMHAPAGVTSPAGRFLQVRARFNRDPNAVLHSLRIPFLTSNLRAVVTEIEASTSEKKDKSTSSGALEASIPASGGPITGSADPKVNLSWKADNPDKDELRYRLEYRRVGDKTWYDMLRPAEVLTKENYEWDTADLPEGHYRVRVVASDELSNPPDRTEQHEMESGVIIVDNTPPAIVELQSQGRRLRGEAVDGVGPIKRIEVSVAGSGEWYPFFPTDGIFDEQRETFDIDVSSLSQSGTALLSVKVYDQAGNFVVRNATLK